MATAASKIDDAEELEIVPAVAEEVEIDTEGGRTDGAKAKPEAEVDAVEEDAPRSRQDGETEEDHQRRTRRRTTKQKSEAVRRKYAAYEAKIADYEQRLAKVETGQAQIADSQRSRDISTLTSNRDQALSRVNSYEEMVSQATVEGKPAGSLVKAMLAAQAEAAQYDQAIAWLKSQPAAQQTNGTGAAPAAKPEATEEAGNPVVAAFRDSFLEDHDWIDTSAATRDPDSKLMQNLSDQIAQRGIPPSSPKHWRELERLGAKALPHRFEGEDDLDEPLRRSAPPIGARRDASPAINGNKVKLPAEMVAMMKETGQWDDPKRRATIAADYARSIKSQAGAR